jgi:hypothetical protein
MPKHDVVSFTPERRSRLGRREDAFDSADWQCPQQAQRTAFCSELEKRRMELGRYSLKKGEREEKRQSLPVLKCSGCGTVGD